MPGTALQSQRPITEQRLPERGVLRRLQVWSLDTLQRVKTLTGHTDAVRALAVSNGKLFSGSYDGSVKVPLLLSSLASLHEMRMIALIASCIGGDGGQLA